MSNTPISISFESFGHENGLTYWWALDFMLMLGYPNMQSFIKPINRAMQACLTANIDTHENFIKEQRIVDGNTVDDYKLTRFACYMIAMNSDSKKEGVAKAQVYFADQVDKINLVLEGTEDLERLLTREETKESFKGLNIAANKAGVINYGAFHHSGYMGMYNRSIKSVQSMKGVPEGHNLMDYMGSTELSANLFRLNLTKERLKHQNVKGEEAAKNVHNKVGKQVRDLVKENTGQNPEDLPTERRLGEVAKQLKKAKKQLNQKRIDDNE